MELSNLIAQLVLIGVVFLLSISVVIMLPIMGEQLELKIRRKRFKAKVNDAYAILQPSWRQVQIIADQVLLKNSKQKNQIKMVLKNILSDLLVGSEDYSKEKIQYLELLITTIEEDEPFDGIPDNLVVHLQKIKAHLGNDSTDIMPLVNELRDLTESRIKEKRNEKIRSYLSVLFGFLGLGSTAYMYFL